jgi:creatinine amidohydrolase/Fe(II)-dependent formamide hydrolase-like protein
VLSALAVIAMVIALCAQPGASFAAEPANEPSAEEILAAALAEARPIDGIDSVWIEELTWMEVRDAIAQGKTTAIIATGGIEQNGPYVATGKHNFILQSACPMLAQALGNALCAPIIKLVPEGNIDPPSGHMFFPGTISVREETFVAVLEDVGASLEAHGFEHIIYIGDSGGNLSGMASAVANLNERWGVHKAHFIREFYDNAGVIALLQDMGITEESEGYHDFYWATAMQMVTDPESVRYEQRVAAGKASINGVKIAPKAETIRIGRALLAYRVERTVAAITQAITGGRD